MKLAKMRALWSKLTFKPFRFLFVAAGATLIILMAILVVHISVLQILPVRFWIKPLTVNVTFSKAGNPLINLYRKTRYDIDVTLVLELHDANNASIQPCAAESHILSEAIPQNHVVFTLKNMFPGCDVDRLRQRQQSWIVQLTYVIILDYGIKKSFTLYSTPFELKEIAPYKALFSI